MQSPGVVDLLDESGQIGGDVVERLVVGQVHGLDLAGRLHRGAETCSARASVTVHGAPIRSTLRTPAAPVQGEALVDGRRRQTWGHRFVVLARRAAEHDRLDAPVTGRSVTAESETQGAAAQLQEEQWHR